jgi:acyl phosphate:glycerol-3-phosphate acyltransferase
MSWELAIRLLASIAFAYLAGGIPWALIIGLKFYKIDLRIEGSGNLGATNVLRVLGAKAAAATLALDIAKGAAAVGVAVLLVPVVPFGVLAHEWAMILATMAAILGHSYSPYIKLKGGKGVATAAGALLVLTPYPWPILLLTWLLVIAIFRIVSLGSIVIAIEYPILCLIFYPGDWLLIGFATVAATLVVWRHRANVVRIFRGQEPKVSFKNRGSAARNKGGT